MDKYLVIIGVTYSSSTCLELGGTDDYVWSIDNDTALEKYGMGSTAEALVESTLSPPVSPPLSLRRSSVSSSVSSDDFFDVDESFHDTQSISSAYATPGSMSPISSSPRPISSSPSIPLSLSPPSPAVSAPQHIITQHHTPAETVPISQGQPITLTSTHQYNVYYWTGLHMGAAFLTSFIKNDHDEQHPHITIAALFSSHPTKNKSNNGIDGFLLAAQLALVQKQQQQQQYEQGNKTDTQHSNTKQEQDKECNDLASIGRHTPHFPHLLPPDDPQSAYALAPFRMRIHRIEHKIVRWARRMFRMSFAYKGAVYWVILYIFLRGPTEHVLRRTLTTVVDTPQQVKYTTIGITAAMAAAIGSSISFSLTTATPRL